MDGWVDGEKDVSHPVDGWTSPLARFRGLGGRLRALSELALLCPMPSPAAVFP